MGLVFTGNSPTRRCASSTSFTWLHRLLWELLHAGGLASMSAASGPCGLGLLRRGHSDLAMELLAPLPLQAASVCAPSCRSRGRGLS